MNDEGMLGPEEIEEVINWAVDIAATLTLMVHEYLPENDMERKNQLERFTGAIVAMFEDMPEAIQLPAQIVAKETIDKIEEEERLVEEFRDQIDKNL